MSNLSLRLPDSLHRKIRQIAEQDAVSINQFIATAVAEKTAALLTVEYLEERGRRSDPKLVDRLLSRVPAVPPDRGDELPARTRQRNQRLQPATAHNRKSEKQSLRTRRRRSRSARR